MPMSINAKQAAKEGSPQLQMVEMVSSTRVVSVRHHNNTTTLDDTITTCDGTRRHCAMEGAGYPLPPEGADTRWRFNPIEYDNVLGVACDIIHKSMTGCSDPFATSCGYVCTNTSTRLIFQLRMFFPYDACCFLGNKTVEKLSGVHELGPSANFLCSLADVLKCSDAITNSSDAFNSEVSFAIYLYCLVALASLNLVPHEYFASTYIEDLTRPFRLFLGLPQDCDSFAIGRRPSSQRRGTCPLCGQQYAVGDVTDRPTDSRHVTLSPACPMARLFSENNPDWCPPPFPMAICAENYVAGYLMSLGQAASVVLGVHVSRTGLCTLSDAVSRKLKGLRLYDSYYTACDISQWSLHVNDIRDEVAGVVLRALSNHYQGSYLDTKYGSKVRLNGVTLQLRCVWDSIASIQFVRHVASLVRNQDIWTSLQLSSYMLCFGDPGTMGMLFGCKRLKFSRSGVIVSQPYCLTTGDTPTYYSDMAESCEAPYVPYYAHLSQGGACSPTTQSVGKLLPRPLGRTRAICTFVRTSQSSKSSDESVAGDTESDDVEEGDEEEDDVEEEEEEEEGEGECGDDEEGEEDYPGGEEFSLDETVGSCSEGGDSPSDEDVSSREYADVESAIPPLPSPDDDYCERVLLRLCRDVAVCHVGPSILFSTTPTSKRSPNVTYRRRVCTVAGILAPPTTATVIMQVDDSVSNSLPSLLCPPTDTPSSLVLVEEVKRVIYSQWTSFHIASRIRVSALSRDDALCEGVSSSALPLPPVLNVSTVTHTYLFNPPLTKHDGNNDDLIALLLSLSHQCLPSIPTTSTPPPYILRSFHNTTRKSATSLPSTPPTSTPATDTAAESTVLGIYAALWTPTSHPTTPDQHYGQLLIRCARGDVRMIPSIDKHAANHHDGSLLPSPDVGTPLPSLVAASSRVMNMCVDQLGDAEEAVCRTVHHLHSLNTLLDTLQLHPPNNDPRGPIDHRHESFGRILSSIPQFKTEPTLSIFLQFKKIREVFRKGWGMALCEIQGGVDQNVSVAHFCEGCCCSGADGGNHPTTPPQLPCHYSMWYRSELVPAEYAALSVLTGMPLPTRGYLDLEDRHLTAAKLRDTSGHHPPTLCFPCFVAMGVAVGVEPFASLPSNDTTNAAAFMVSAMKVLLVDNATTNATSALRDMPMEGSAKVRILPQLQQSLTAFRRVVQSHPHRYARSIVAQHLLTQMPSIPTHLQLPSMVASRALCEDPTLRAVILYGRHIRSAIILPPLPTAAANILQEYADGMLSICNDPSSFAHFAISLKSTLVSTPLVDTTHFPNTPILPTSTTARALRGGHPEKFPESTVVRYFSDSMKDTARDGTALLSAEHLRIQIVTRCAADGRQRDTQYWTTVDAALSHIMYAIYQHYPHP